MVKLMPRSIVPHGSKQTKRKRKQTKYVYYFTQDDAEGGRDDKNLLGGKGASLVEKALQSADEHRGSFPLVFHAGSGVRQLQAALLVVVAELGQRAAGGLSPGEGGE